MDQREIINKLDYYFENGNFDPDVAAGVEKRQEDAEWLRLVNIEISKSPELEIVNDATIKKFNKRKKQRRATCGRRTK